MRCRSACSFSPPSLWIVTLTRGGKLFAGIFLLLWYLALNGLPAVDFTGLLAAKPDLRTEACYLAIGALWSGAAMAWERRRSRGV